MSETVRDLRWHVGCSVDSDTYRYLLDLCKLHGIDLPDLIGYLVSVGISSSAGDLSVTLVRGIDRVVN